MKLLQNKIFIVAVCLMILILSGLIFADRVFGSLTSSAIVTKPLVIPAPTNVSVSSMQAVNVSYLNSAGYLKSPFILENRTSDPISPAVGQMWIRIDQ